MKRPSIVALVSCLAVLLVSATPERASADDEPGPTLALRTDASRSDVRVGATVDVAAMLFGQYGLRAGFAIGRHQSIWVGPSFHQRFGLRGASMELVYDVRPMGRSLEGLHIGVSALVAYFPATRPVRYVRGGAELGYTHLWGRALLGVAAGALRTLSISEQGSGHRPFSALVRAQLGYAFH